MPALKLKPLLIFACLALTATFAVAQGDSAGVVKATTKLRPDGSSTTTILDPDKRTEEETFTNGAGKVLKKTVYSLDERNTRTGATHLDLKGNIRYKEVYTRDAENRIVESRFFSADNRPLGRRVFTFDLKGNAQVTDYDANGVAIVKPVPAGGSRSGKRRR